MLNSVERLKAIDGILETLIGFSPSEVEIVWIEGANGESYPNIHISFFLDPNIEEIQDTFVTFPVGLTD